MKYLIIGLLLTFGCSPVKQVLRSPEKTLIVVDTYLQKYPIVSDTFFQTVKGDTISVITAYTDTVYSNSIDSIVKERVITKYLTKTIKVTDTVIKTVIDRTFQTSLQRDLIATNVVLDQRVKDLSEMKASRNKFRLWFWITVGALSAGGIIFTYLKIKA